MSEVTDERFSKGNVAQTLRKILYPEFISIKWKPSLYADFCREGR